MPNSTTVNAVPGPGPSTALSRSQSRTGSDASPTTTIQVDESLEAPKRDAGDASTSVSADSIMPIRLETHHPKSALHTNSYEESDPHFSSHARFAGLPAGDPVTTHHTQEEDHDGQHATGRALAASAGTVLPSSSIAPTNRATSASQSATEPTHPQSLQLDIEHIPVTDDPRAWSDRKKTAVLILVAMATLTPFLAASIYNPAFEQLREDLGATDDQLALSVSLFILFQGCWPAFWSSIGEVKGRKWLYVISFSFFITGSVVASRAQSMKLLIGMRMVQAFGSASVLSLGAGTLSDMYERHERGTKLGIYYGLPLLGPSAGPIVGGFLSSAFSWRATFYLIAALAGVTLAFFFFLPDSWRKERSQLYQVATRRALKRALAHHEKEERNRERKRRRGLGSGATTPGATMTGTGTGVGTRSQSGARTPMHEVELGPGEKVGTLQGVDVERKNSVEGKAETSLNAVRVDLEKKDVTIRDLGPAERGGSPLATKASRKWTLRKRDRETTTTQDEEHEEVVLTFADVNPFPAMWAILEVPSNLVVLVSSGLLFACQYTIPFTAAVTFSAAPYDYQPWRIGLVLLAFGGGNVIGSLLGGRYSDYMLRRLKKANGGVGEPEMRLQSTTRAMFFMVPSFLTYAWVCQKKTMIAGPVVALFGAGFFLMIIYASALAYLVDANPGRSSSAVAANSFFRGVFACVCSQISLPIRNGIGDGGLYTLLSGVLVVSCLGFYWVIKRGKGWRHSGRRLFRGVEKEDQGRIQGQS